MEAEKHDLAAKLEQEKAAHAATQFKHAVGGEFLQYGGRHEALALDVIVAKAARDGFAKKDGQVTSTTYSATHPGEPLTLKEWVMTVQTEASWLFLPSRGGGATASQGPIGPVKRVVASDDPYAFGLALEEIASGRADVK